MDHLSGFNSSEDYRLELFHSLDIMCYVVYGLVFVVGALGNGVVVWATAFKLKRTASTVWFLNLAVSDLLFAATLPLGIMHQALDFEWPLGRVMCKLHLTVDSLTMFASVYLLVVISVDRCVSVAWPSSAWVQKNRQGGGAWRRKASYVSVAGVWALAAVLDSPLFLAADTPPSRYVLNSTECMVMFNNSTSALVSDYFEYESSGSNTLAVSQVRLNERALNVSYFLLGYVVPIVVIVSCYAVILWRRNAGGGGRRSPLGRPFSVAAAVMASFFLCFGPYHVTSVFYAAPGEDSTFDALHGEDSAFDALHAVWTYVAGCLEALYRCLNPLLYATVARDLRNKESVLEVLESAFAEEEEPRSEPSADLPLSDKE